MSVILILPSVILSKAKDPVDESGGFFGLRPQNDRLSVILIDPPMKAKERFAYKGHHIPQERVQALVEKQVQYLKGKKVLLYEMNGKVFADRIEK